MDKYDEALKTATQWIKDGCTDKEKICLECVFPELREIEDERIRKWILEYLYDGLRKTDEEFKEQFKVSIAWLEKHKVNTEGDFGRGYDCGYQAGYAVAMNEMKPKVATATLCSEEKQKEQKPNIELIQRSWYMEGYHDREFGKEPKWIIKTGEGGPKHELNPKYGQPLAGEQKPAEWSEEDREMFTRICIANPNLLDKERNWLIKSIRPQLHWKPSEEQMGALDAVVGLIPPKCKGFDLLMEHIQSLRKDLLKLKSDEK